MSELIQITRGPTRRGKRPGQTAESSRRQPLPPWIRVRLRQGPELARVRGLMRESVLHTVCEEARCPNLWECWNRGTATFMILGDVCTRSCGFCAVKTGRPSDLDWDEPRRVAKAVTAMDLRHVVVTSVNRDELPDGGAAVFCRTIRAIRVAKPECTIEVLVPDFQGSDAALTTVLDAEPDILTHNTETVPRLYPIVRPQARYNRSLHLLQRAKAAGAAVTKTGLMVGLGETGEEVLTVCADLRRVGCDVLTLGQYLQPTRDHLPVSRYYSPGEFDDLRRRAVALGFAHVEAGPLVRSSYHAEEQAASAAGTIGPHHPSAVTEGARG